MCRKNCSTGLKNEIVNVKVGAASETALIFFCFFLENLKPGIKFNRHRSRKYLCKEEGYENEMWKFQAKR